MKSIRTFFGHNHRIVVAFFVGMALMIGTAQVLAVPTNNPPGGIPTANFSDVNVGNDAVIYGNLTVLGTITGSGMGVPDPLTLNDLTVTDLNVTNINGSPYSPSSSGVSNPMEGNFTVTGIYPPSNIISPQATLTGNITGRQLHSTNNSYVGKDLFVEERVIIDGAYLILNNGNIGAPNGEITVGNNIKTTGGNIISTNGYIFAGPLANGYPVFWTNAVRTQGNITASNALHAGPGGVNTNGDVTTTAGGGLNIAGNSALYGAILAHDSILVSTNDVPGWAYVNNPHPERGIGDISAMDDLFAGDTLYANNGDFGNNVSIGGDLTVSGDIIGLPPPPVIPNPFVIGSTTYKAPFVSGDVVAQGRLISGNDAFVNNTITVGNEIKAGTIVTNGGGNPTLPSANLWENGSISSTNNLYVDNSIFSSWDGTNDWSYFRTNTDGTARSWATNAGFAIHGGVNATGSGAYSGVGGSVYTSPSSNDLQARGYLGFVDSGVYYGVYTPDDMHAGGYITSDSGIGTFVIVQQTAGNTSTVTTQSVDCPSQSIRISCGGYVNNVGSTFQGAYPHSISTGIYGKRCIAQRDGTAGALYASATCFYPSLTPSEAQTALNSLSYSSKVVSPL